MKYIPYVNIKMGSDSSYRFSNGNTLPLIQRPFGMISFSPQSEVSKGYEGWFFKPQAPYLEGIRLTHQPSPWIGDYGTLLLTPQTDIISNNASGAYSGYRIKDSVFRPDYLKIKFLRSSCLFELATTERAGKIRLTFENDTTPYLSILSTKGSYTFKLDKRTNTILGTSDAHSQDNSKSFTMYFVLRFPSDTIDFDKTTYSNADGYLHIALKKKQLEASIAISYISHEMALLSLKRECGKRKFDTVKRESEAIWESTLHKIEIDTKSKKQKRTFYSCLYRSFLFPRIAYELDREENPVHYSPFLAEARAGVRYTDTGFWDTSRTLFPLFSLIARKELAKMLEGFINDYKESGWLPRWTSLGEVGCMPSTLIDSVIADATHQNIISGDLLKTALEGMLHHATTPSNERRYGREGIREYLKYGYVPCDMYKESVNLTLDFAYGDWCIHRVAKELGEEELADEYLARSKNYQRLFDKETGFMRGKDSNGKMRDGFDPSIWGVDYTEGSAWQSSFFVPHDIEGLVALYGGRAELIKKLDSLFNEKPSYRVHGYGGEIHEMTEMAMADFGQCAISNQPSFHIPYIYACIGEEEKCSLLVEKMCNELFSPEDNGYPGDEDNGSMSAWYIFSTLGFYPICPGKDMVHTRPLVKSFKINTPEESEKR